MRSSKPAKKATRIARSKKKPVQSKAKRKQVVKLPIDVQTMVDSVSAMSRTMTSIMRQQDALRNNMAEMVQTMDRLHRAAEVLQKIDVTSHRLIHMMETQWKKAFEVSTDERST
jgi:hypothetical protein